MIAWTPERVAVLTALWNQGVSQADIARRMGLTKNIVTGKAHRLMLIPRPARLKEPTFTANSALSKSDNLGCRFIEGDVLEQFAAGKTYDQIICGKPVKELGESYCAEHHAICWTAPPKRNNKPFIDLQSAPREKAA